MVLGAQQPKKALGQHWLHDESVLEMMCDAAGIEQGQNVLEIGPGTGTLTARLLGRSTKVVALEFDKDLANNLVDNVALISSKKGADSRLSVVHGDIRTYDFTAMPTPYRVCANIPYYLTSNLIRRLCETENKPVCVALLIQKEVAERIVAADGRMSMLSCVAQFSYDCSLGVVVPPEYFTPPPKVDSQILILTLRDTPPVDVKQKEFFRVIKAGFSEKRKNLRNALSSGLSISKENIGEMLARCDIDERRRAETLSFQEWEKIYRLLDEYSK